MTRSSRHKSHKQHKHNSKDAREQSDSEEDVKLKDRESRIESTVRVSRDSTSGEKRKLVSQSQDSKDLFDPGNGDLSDEYVASKRRKGRADAAVADRWNGNEAERGKGVVGDGETKREDFRRESEKGPKSKVLVDSKSKSSRRNDSLSERKEGNAFVAGENEEAKKSSSKVESKRKSEKDSGRKEVSQYKDAKEKERGTDKDRKVQDVRHEKSIDTRPGTGAAGSEVSRKQGNQTEAFEDDRPVKHEVENIERNPEVEKEFEKRIRQRRDSSGDKDKCQDDVKDSNDRRLSSRDDHANNGRYKDERHKDGRYRDKYHEDSDRDRRHRDDKHRDERSLKYHTDDRSKHLRDENKAAENHHKKSKPQECDCDGSPHPDDRGIKYKENRGKKRSDEKDDHSDVKPRSTKEHFSDVEKKSLSSGKVESLGDKARSQSRDVDVDSVVSNNRRKSSPSSSAHVSKDQYRHRSNQADSKYRDSVSEERIRANVSGIQERTSECQSLDKACQDDNHLGELSAERSPRSDVQTSPMHFMEKSPSSTNIDRGYSNRNSVRQSLDVEETGRRTTSSKDSRDYFIHEERGNRELPLEKSAVDEFSQADGDTVSASSSFNRTGHLPSSSSSHLPLPPPFRAGFDGPSVLGSSEEDGRGKSANRFKRVGDPSVGRGQGNAWKGVTHWPPMTNGYIPFQHGPPPGGFHGVMPQFAASPLFGRPSMELNHAGLPYHDRFSGVGRPFMWRNPVDEPCPPHLHGWDGSDSIFGEDPHMYGRPDWDQNRHLMSVSADMWKGQNGALNMNLSTASINEDYLQRAPAEEIWTGQSGHLSRKEQNRSGPRAESIEIKQSSCTPPKDTSEAPPITIHERTTDPCEVLSDDDDGVRFCHVYLSNLDISEDLTHSELYDECMDLLTNEGNNTVEDVNKHVHPDLKEGAKPGVNFSNVTCPSLFPAIKDSIFQRALDLYKKQSEKMKAKLLFLSFPESEPGEVLTSNIGRLEQVLTSNQEEMEEPDPTFKPEEAEEPVPTFDLEETHEPEPTPRKRRPEKVEGPMSTLDDEMAEESVSNAGEEKLKVTVPTANQDKMELVASSNQEKSEEAIGDQFSSFENASQITSNSPRSDEDINSGGNSKGNPLANSAEEQQVFSAIMCGPLGFSDGSKACEAVMPESIECGSVNLSRIHHSPESTH